MARRNVLEVLAQIREQFIAAQISGNFLAGLEVLRDGP